ncbi:MAG TPA: hypothetical protein VNW46_05330 [Gemmatimonadaceae bacterium]|nr:hypothetical protein [Gemmatimonadaceae bacterium]
MSVWRAYGAAAVLGLGLTIVACGGDHATAPPAAPSVLNLTLGQSAVFLDSAHMLTHLDVQAGQRYLIAVVNTDASSGSLEDFDLHGTFAPTTGMASIAQARLSAPSAAQGSTAAPSGLSRSLPSSLPSRSHGTPAISGTEMRHLMAVTARAEHEHLRRMAVDRALATRLGNPFPKLAARQTRLTAQALGGPSTTIGGVAKFFVRRFGYSCSDGDTIGARTVAISNKAIIVADTTSSWTQRPDSNFYQTVANEYDIVTYPMVTTYVGDPLLMDASLSKVGKVTIVITPKLNLDNGIAAFVNPCDYVDEAGSNHSETIYNWVADATNGYPLGLWERFLRPTLAHETKHVSSFAKRYSDGGVFETVWLEEATAQMSSEIWMRNYDQTGWKTNAGFDQTLGCEFVTTSGCYDATKPAGLFNHLEFLYQYLDSASDSVDTEGLGSTIEGEYGAGWSFARWTADQYASSEQTFLHGIIDDQSHTSVANLQQRSGQSAATLQVYWVLATALDSIQVTPTDPRLTVPSFNFFNIFAVADSVFKASFPRLEPVWPKQLASGTFDKQVTKVPGLAGASYIMLTVTATGTQTLELRSGSGGNLTSASGLRVGVVRVQ